MDSVDNHGNTRRSRENIFGGHDYYENGVRVGSTRANSSGGWDTHGNVKPSEVAQKSKPKAKKP